MWNQKTPRKVCAFAFGYASVMIWWWYQLGVFKTAITETVVSKKFYEMVYANCLRASEKGFNLADMLSAAISFNARLTINGQDVRSDRERLDVDVLIDLVVACYCMAYGMRYGAGRVVEQFTSQEKDKRSSSRLGFLRLVAFCAQQLVPTTWVKKKWNSFVDFMSEKKETYDMTFKVTESVRVVTIEEHVLVMAGYEHHAGSAVLQSDEGDVDLLDIRDVLELKYEKGKLMGVPKTRPTKPSPEAVVVSPASNMAAAEGKRTLKKRTNEAVRVLSRLSATQPLDDTKLAVLRDLRNPTKSDCGSLHTVRMVGDGRCAFYAMLHCIGLEPSVVLRC